MVSFDSQNGLYETTEIPKFIAVITALLLSYILNLVKNNKTAIMALDLYFLNRNPSQAIFDTEKQFVMDAFFWLKAGESKLSLEVPKVDPGHSI